MTIRTLLRYLIGDREAILQIAANRHAMWLGAIFVLSAGFAREYDGEDLLHEPWHLALPLAASLVSSFLLFSVCYIRVMKQDAARPTFLSAYGSFLGLFWMTAPLAWLYAIPYERFLSPYGATVANLLTLGFVAVWRVILMIQVLQVLMDYSGSSALILVMFFGDIVAFLAMLFVPTPVIELMGGVRGTPSDVLLFQVKFCVMGLGGCTLLFWLAGVISVLSTGKATWRLPPSKADQSPPPEWPLQLLAIISMAIWIPILPWTLREQENRRLVEQTLKSGHIADGLAFMSARTPADFPPQWDPPPRIGFNNESPPLFDVLDAIVEQSPSRWVRAKYLDKLDNTLGNEWFVHFTAEEQRLRVVHLLQRLPEGQTLVAKHHDRLERAFRPLVENRPEERAQVEALLQAAKQLRINDEP